MKYTDVLSTYIPAASAAYLAFPDATCWRASTAWKPKYETSGNFQISAQGYNYFSGIYSKAIVLKSVCVVDIHQRGQLGEAIVGTADTGGATKTSGVVALDTQSEYNMTPIMFALHLDSEETTPSPFTWDQMRGDRYTKLARLVPNQSGTGHCRMKIAYNASRFWGIKDIMAKDSLVSASQALAADLVYFNLGFQFEDKSGSGTLDSPLFYVRTTITYWVKFDDCVDIQLADFPTHPFVS